MRKFSIPYNGSKPDEYLNLVDNYQPYIDSIYFGVPVLKSFAPVNEQFDYVYNFLEYSMGKYKRLLACNHFKYDEFNTTTEFIEYFQKVIYPIIEQYNIEGVILTNLELSRQIRKDFPKLELHTSSNCFQYNLRTMKNWQRYGGINVFNPPRDAAKTPSMLKEMHDAGFKLKVIVNQACIYGCGYQLNHGIISNDYFCGHGDRTNIFKTNVILPEWLKYIDEYVDVYKIAGRLYPLFMLKKIFDAYILEKPYTYVNEIINSSENNPFRILEKGGIFIKPEDIPEKTRWCECKDCDTKCFECRNAIEKLLF